MRPGKFTMYFNLFTAVVFFVGFLVFTFSNLSVWLSSDLLIIRSFALLIVSIYYTFLYLTSMDFELDNSTLICKSLIFKTEKKIRIEDIKNCSEENAISRSIIKRFKLKIYLTGGRRRVVLDSALFKSYHVYRKILYANGLIK